MSQPAALRSHWFMRVGVFTLGVFTSLSFAGFAGMEHWDDANAPERIAKRDIALTARYQDLPASAKVRNLPWSDTYWPSQHAGIAWRWKSLMGPQNFSYNVFSLDGIARMTPESRAALSPAEKLEAVLGYTDHRYVRSERARTMGVAHQDWAGLCHGWASASTIFAEPEPITIRARNGTLIPFSSSDIKALLIYYYAVYSGATKEGVSSMGGRCLGAESLNFTGDPRRDAPVRSWEPQNETSAERNARRLRDCKDVNAGAFHIILGSYIGRSQKPFLADLDNSRAIWNHPVVGYASRVYGESKVIHPNADPRTVREIQVETTITYVEEGDPSHYRIGAIQKTKTYRYTLELDSLDETKANIVGGTWITLQRPDYLWTVDTVALRGDFEFLNSIVSYSR